MAYQLPHPSTARSCQRTLCWWRRGWECGYPVHYPSFIWNNCPTSQGRSRRGEAGVEVELQIRGFTHPFRGGEDGFLAVSPENGQSLLGRKIPNRGTSFSWQKKIIIIKIKATAILSWCLYGQCSGSSRNKPPTGFFWVWLPSFSSHMGGVWLKNANEFNY